MFVSIVNTNTDAVDGHTMIHECTGIHLKQPKGKPDTVFVTLERKNDVALEIEIDKVTQDIYVMNDTGRTIDKYVWHD